MFYIYIEVLMKTEYLIKETLKGLKKFLLKLKASIYDGNRWIIDEF
jgi:hypothetical protein